MILLYLILILMAGGIVAWLTGKKNPLFCRIISLITVLADLLIVLVIAFHGNPGQNGIMEEFSYSWIPKLGIGIHLSLDGLSLVMLILTFFIGALAVVISWNEINQKTAFFHFNILFILAGISGVFLSMDLFLFYFFWEVMLIPMYFLIAIWGHERRIYASFKFFIFTQASGLLMFLAIIGIYLVHGHNTGVYTFEYQQLIGTAFPSAGIELLLMGGFLIAFIVKLPAFPFHNWLPDAHTEAPTAGSLILASLMLKTGAYGIIRFAIPLFPDASAAFAPVGMTLGVIGILYGAMLAYSQTDLKRLVAYTSVSHMGFVILGVYAFNEIAYQGVVMQMVAHGISTGALFIIVGQLYERLHTRDLGKMGGLWERMPGLGAMGLVFSMASLGLPGLGNFVAEFLTLTGTFKSSILFSSLASIGLVFATVYSLRILQKVFFEKRRNDHKVWDLTLRESIVMASLVLAILFTGLFPQPVIKKASQISSEKSIMKTTNNVPATFDNRKNENGSCLSEVMNDQKFAYDKH